MIISHSCDAQMTLGPVHRNCLAPPPFGGQAAVSKPGSLPFGIRIVTPDARVLFQGVISPSSAGLRYRQYLSL
jgi:hypothetical protein